MCNDYFSTKIVACFLLTFVVNAWIQHVSVYLNDLKDACCCVLNAWAHVFLLKHIPCFDRLPSGVCFNIYTRQHHFFKNS